MLLAALQIIYFARAFIFSARAFTGSSRELGMVDFSLQLPEPYSMCLKKVCPQCDATLHARKLACPCGHVFPAKAQQTKRKRPIESRQSDNAYETGEETRKRQAQNQERMARLRQSETREQSMKRQAQNQERMASLRQSETREQSMKRQAQNQERMASLRQSETREQSMKRQ